MSHLLAPETKRILVVDDDPMMREALSHFLKPKGYAVETAKNGLQALEKLNSTSVPFAAVLLDMNMPVMDGMETLATIKSETPELPVIVLTANKSKEVIDQARSLGAFDYISKPPDMARVATLLAACCS